MKYYGHKESVVDYGSNEYQLCWTCKNACNGGCSWSKEFKPVDGWTAEKTTIPVNGEYAETYKIIKCPEYKSDRRYGKHKKGE